MEDRELDMIRNDADNIQIPESLSPDNMMAKIAKKKAEGYFEESKKEEKKSKKRHNISKKAIAWMGGGAATIAAAASVGIILFGSGAGKVNDSTGKVHELNNNPGIVNELSIYESIAKNAFGDENNVEILSNYDKLAQYFVSQNTMRRKQSAADKLEDYLNNVIGKDDEILYEESIKGESTLDGAINGTAPGVDENEDMSDNESQPDYSETNTRTENVSEADIVKTDGKYIYYLTGIGRYSDSENIMLTIVKADGDKTVKVSEIAIEQYFINAIKNQKNAYLSANEMMIFEDKLVVIGENAGYSVLAFFDIKDKSEPKYLNALFVEGEYDSCRMVDGYLYLFADKNINNVVGKYYNYSGMSYVGIPYVGMPYSEMSVDSIKEEIIPCTSQGEVPEEDVFIAKCEDLSVYHMIGTVDMSDTSSFKQVKAVLGSGSGVVYVSAENIYYVSSVYEGYEEYNVGDEVQCAEKSELIRLSYKDGCVEATGRTVIDGVTGDEFAIDEYEGYLRIAVSAYFWTGYVTETKVEYYNGTEWVDDVIKTTRGTSYNSYKELSSLYVLDEDLKIVGSIPDLKENEQVYGVRFDGDIAYVVTYKQMDPLFTIDLSDPANPTILGALKIPGFSTYLHKWDENKLIGLGYDEHWNVKISTFDITDKKDVKEVDVCVLKDSYASEALYNHKAVFISAKNNLVGFMDSTGCYRIFSYVDGVLTEVIKAEMDVYITDNARGLYIGEYIYIVGEYNGVYVYRMSDFEQVTEVN